MALHFQVAYSGITVGDEICDLLATTLVIAPEKRMVNYD